MGTVRQQLGDVLNGDTSMRHAFPLIIAALLLIGAAAADYSGTVGADGVAAAGDSNSTNHTATAGSTTVTVSGSSPNYTANGTSYTADADPNIPPLPEEEDDGDDDDGGGSSGGTFYPTSRSDPAPAATTRSFTSYVSSRNDSFSVSSPRADMAVSGIRVAVSAQVRNAKLTVVEEVDAASRQETSSFSGGIYRLFDIEHDDIPSEGIESATLSFDVAKTWLESEDAAEDDVVLYRYDGFSWDSLPTEESDENTTHVSYEADSPGLSTFLVGSESEDEAPAATGMATGDNQTSEEPANETGDAGEQAQDSGSAGAQNEDPFAGYEEEPSGGASFVWLGAALLVLVAVIVGVMLQAKKRKRKQSSGEKQSSGAKKPSEEKRAEGQPAGKQPEKQPGKKEGEEKPQETAEKESGETEPSHEGTGQKPSSSTGTSLSSGDGSSEASDQQGQSSSQEGGGEEPLFVDNDEQVLTDFLRKAFEKGYLLEHIQPKLVEKGWTPEQLQHCVKKLGKG